MTEAAIIVCHPHAHFLNINAILFGRVLMLADALGRRILVKELVNPCFVIIGKCRPNLS